MPNKTKYSQLRSKVPNHNTRIQATSGQLFHVWIKRNTSNRIFMTTKALFKTGIVGSHRISKARQINGFCFVAIPQQAIVNWAGNFTAVRKSFYFVCFLNNVILSVL